MIYSLWIFPSLALLPACWIVRSRGIDRNYPFFSAFIYYSAAIYPLSLAVLIDFGPRTYTSLEIAIELVFYCLIAASLVEVGCDLFWPRRAQPAWVWRNMLTLVAAGVAGTIVLADYVRPVNGGAISRIVLRIDQTAVGPAWVLSAVIFLYALWVGRPFRRVNASISAGFVLLLTVDFAATYIRATSSWPIAMAAAYIGQIAFTASVVLWAWMLRVGVPAWVRPNMSEVEYRLRLSRELMRIAESM